MSWIRIGEPQVRGDRVDIDFTVSEGLDQYFRDKHFYAVYEDAELEDNEGIAVVPLISSIITLAWLEEADIYVDRVDRVFHESMNHLQGVFQSMPYRDIPFNTEIHANEFVVNGSNVEGYALFFSGGLDSTYCLYKHLGNEPHLLMVLGFDVWRSNTRNREIWSEWRTTYREYAESVGLPITFIRTNTREIMREHIVQRNHSEKFYPKLYWNSMRHSPMLIGLAAPLSINRFNRVMISASRHSSRRPETHIFCSYPETDEIFKWGDVEVKHCGYIPRGEKIKYIKPMLQRGEVSGFRPCWHPVKGLNCNRCEKCYRTILALLLENVDPNQCGLKAGRGTYKEMKKFILGEGDKKLDRASNVYEGYWLPMKKNIPLDIDKDRGVDGSSMFMEWYRDLPVNRIYNSQQE